jgi:hypothetical protein
MARQTTEDSKSTLPNELGKLEDQNGCYDCHYVATYQDQQYEDYIFFFDSFSSIKYPPIYIYFTCINEKVDKVYHFKIQSWTIRFEIFIGVVMSSSLYMLHIIGVKPDVYIQVRQNRVTTIQFVILPSVSQQIND